MRATYRLSGKVEMGGPTGDLAVQHAGQRRNAHAGAADAGVWLGNKFNRLYLNNVKTPDVKRVNVTVDLLPERRVAAIENAWVAESRSAARRVVPVKVFLRPYRGEPIERDVHGAAFPRGWPRATIACC